MSDKDLLDQIRAVLAEKLLIRVESPETDLLDVGGLDSISLVELAVNIENRFGCRIDFSQVEIDDFRSIASIAKFVASATTKVIAGGVNEDSRDKRVRIFDPV